MADQTKQVVIDGELVTVPADASDAHISAALNAIPAANAKDVPAAKTWAPSDSGALTMAGTAAAVSPAARLLAEFGTSPTAAKTLANVARGATTLAAAGHGVMSGSPSEVIAAPMEGWAAGKGAYFLGKGMQSVARPVATALDNVAPYAKGIVRTAAGAQGVLDLAQMAEPNRKDIGFLGIGPHVNVTEGPQVEPKYSAMQAGANAIASKIMDAVKALVDKGMSEKEAVRTLLNLKAKGQ